MPVADGVFVPWGARSRGRWYERPPQGTNTWTLHPSFATGTGTCLGSLPERIRMPPCASCVVAQYLDTVPRRRLQGDARPCDSCRYMPAMPQLLAYSSRAAALRRGVEVSTGAPVSSCGPGVRAIYGDRSPPPAHGQRSCSSYRQHLSQPDDRPAFRSPDQERQRDEHSHPRRQPGPLIFLSTTIRISERSRLTACRRRSPRPRCR